MAFDGDVAPNNVDRLCDLAAWSRCELAERLGLGERVLSYYLRDGGPRWLLHALVGITVLKLGLSTERARELFGVTTNASGS